jgi:adenylate kinase
LVLLGPPGAGKGTQSRLLEQKFKIPQVASGDLLRAAVRQRTPIGVEARRYMDRGALVPDEVVLQLVQERLSQPDAEKGFILDGFPRTLQQAEALDQWLEEKGFRLNKVLQFIIPDEEIVKRISGRRTCKECGAMFHVIFDPPRNFNICNQCNGDLYQRDDDAEDTVRMRLEVYAKEIQPLVHYYEQQGLLAPIDAVGTHDQVFERILKASGAAAQ